MWSHYCDFIKVPDATDAYRVWSSFFRKSHGGFALDTGCAVGRLSLELGKSHSRVIGIDTSITFIEKARELVQTRNVSFDLIIEGLITERKTCDLADCFHFDHIDFLVADATALPFPGSIFSTVTSINILEKVSSPMTHLKDINRVLDEKNAMFVFSDPFSWDETISPPGQWISSGLNANSHLRGMESMKQYFQGKDGIFDPPLSVGSNGNVPWKIRKTENLWEHITSQYIVGTR